MAQENPKVKNFISSLTGARTWVILGLVERTTFASLLRTARKRIGLSQAEAAARLGVSKRSWWGWEAGRNTPGIDDLPRLALILGCEPATLIPPVTLAGT